MDVFVRNIKFSNQKLENIYLVKTKFQQFEILWFLTFLNVMKN